MWLGNSSPIALPSYAESVLSGNGAFALTYDAKSVTDPRAELGIRTDKVFGASDGVLTLRGRLAWGHDFNPNRTIAATFWALPDASFVVNGAAQAAGLRACDGGHRREMAERLVDPGSVRGRVLERHAVLYGQGCRSLCVVNV